MRNVLRNLAVLLVLSLLAVACGQKPGVHLQGAAGPGGGGGGDQGEFAEGDWDADGDFDGDFGEGDEFAGEGVDGDFGADGGDGTAGGGADGTGGDAGGAGGGDGSPGSTASGNGGGGSGGSGGGGSGGGGSGDGGQQASGGPNDSRGVSDSAIKIGVHAPLSGAAPLPQGEFQSGRDMYWKHGDKKVGGREVQVIVRDDTYQPSRATQVCRELIEREQVFVLIGGGGADQIRACAIEAARAGVPYLSAGVDEGDLRRLPNYFALSMSYPQQAPLVAQYVDKHVKPGDGKVGILHDRTVSFRNVLQRFEEEIGKRGMRGERWQISGNKAADAQWASQFDTAFIIGAPSDFVQILQQPGGTDPHWVGVGITMGLNTVASTGCGARGAYKGSFLSPFPGLNQINNLDPEFRKAGGEGDIELALWGLNKTLHEILKPIAENPTRSGFINVLQTQRIKTNVYPELAHSRDDHFGAQSAHLLRVNCSSREYETPNNGLFVKGF